MSVRCARGARFRRPATPPQVHCRLLPSVHRIRPASVAVAVEAHSPPLSAVCSRDSAGGVTFPPAWTSSDSISFLAGTKQSKPTCPRKDQPVFVWTSLADSGKSEAVKQFEPKLPLSSRAIHSLSVIFFHHDDLAKENGKWFSFGVNASHIFTGN